MPEIKTELTEDELLSLLERNLDASDPYTESLLGEQRDQAHRYYYGEALGNELKGRSQHVSRDVFDAVESTKALLLDTFTADRNVCQFTPQTFQDIPKAREATAWVNYLFYRQNSGFKILHDTVHDGLVAKLGVVKRWWDEKIVFVEEEFQGVNEAQYISLVNQPDVEITDVEQETIQAEMIDQFGAVLSPQITTYSGTLNRRIDRSQVRVENVAPEKLRISARAKTLETSDFVSYEDEVEIGELLEAGYDPDKVMELDEELDNYRNGVEGRSAYDETTAATEMRDDHPNRSFVTIYESYIRIYDPDVENRVTLKVIHSRRTILDMEKVENHPYRGWCPFPIPHKAIGMSLADVTMDIQKSQSSLKRSVIDNAFMTNTTRWLANLSLVRNPRDLIDNRVGAVIDVNAMDPSSVVQPLNTPQISPSIFTTMEVLEQEKEARSGSSRMSKGMDSDVVSKQNSSDLVTRYMNASNRRTMVMARHFAESFLMPLMYDLYRLSKENDTKRQLVQLEGGFTEITPSELDERTEMTVAVALTPEARAAEARSLIMLDQMFTANPADQSVAGMYDRSQRYALLSDAIELMGLKGGMKYLENPMSPQYQQKMQQAQAQGQQRDEMMKQMEMKKLELEERKVVTDEQKVQQDAAKVQIDEDRLLLDVQVAKNDFILRAQKVGDDAEKFDTDTALNAIELRHKMKVETQNAENQRMAMDGD